MKSRAEVRSAVAGGNLGPKKGLAEQGRGAYAHLRCCLLVLRTLPTHVKEKTEDS